MDNTTLIIIILVIIIIAGGGGTVGAVGSETAQDGYGAPDE
jgi:hypothetical protein